jgi:TatD DNase family protein
MSKMRPSDLMLIDSHCHLDYFKPEELPAILQRAGEAGVGQMVTIGTTLDQSRRLPAMVEGHAGLWCTVGVHPHHAAEAPVPAPEELVALTDNPKVIGIGEAGLDYFYDRAPRDVQQESFRVHIRAARLAGLPLAIHARDADDDIARILQDERESGGDFAFLLHCFSSSRALAEAAVAMGGYVSFSGILTFPRSNELRDVARDLPADRLLVETDAPYLAPVPFRGKRNEPSYVAHTARVLAETRGLEPAALADLTTENFRRLFRKAA